jgi:hypothetical protein
VERTPTLHAKRSGVAVHRGASLAGKRLESKQRGSMPMKNNKSETSPKYLSEAIIIAVTSASAYYFSYTYEKSFLSYFGIPPQFISIDITTMLSFGAIVFGALVLTFPALNMFTILLSSTKNEHIVRLVRPYWMFLFLILVHLYFFRFDKWTLLITYIVVCFFFAFFDFIFPLITQRDKKTYAEKLRAQEETESHFRSLPQEVAIRYGRETATMVMLLAIGYVVSSNAGLAEAMRQKDFLFTNTQPQFVVIRIYSDRLICAQYDDMKNEILQKFSVIKLGENTPILSLKSVGPLHPAATATPRTPTPIPTATIVVTP